MDHVFAPVFRQSLSDDIAQRITQLIQSGDYRPGARLPAITRMASQFGVGSPTLREALKKLETVGVVDIRHGSGVYVGKTPDSLLITNPVLGATPTKKLLVDLISARIPIEVETAALAATNATVEHLDEMERLLAQAGDSLGDSAVLNQVNLSFHGQIALASGNTVMHQILDVLASLFRQEQRMILSIHGRSADDHAEHLEICAAVAARDPELASRRMQQHLERVRDKLLSWDPQTNPVS
jgi:GntR family transcriptional regulator, transcriptional repressor for pyruvate dehydrogenase complex